MGGADSLLKAHPLDPLGPDEISQATAIVRKSNDHARIFFRAISLSEPPKKEMIDFLGSKQASGTTAVLPARQARIQAYITNKLHEIIVNLDGIKDMKDRWTMAWFYMSLSDNPDANYYVYPLDIRAEVSNSLEVVKIYRLPSVEHEKTSNMSKEFDRTKFHSGSEYHPDLAEERRTTTRPYNITQPEGPSFSIDGNQIAWEK
ncbi:hypothetical protein LZ31DRAFT_595223 [Colletotrichum somersetense]|nr:hypothetical protein LZ31DRAFT_595223 [Colletotrichum somersetense]